MDFSSDAAFATAVCEPLLLDAENADGGWGFHAGEPSRAEATCWALKALLSSNTLKNKNLNAIERGLQFLTAAQIADGSWPSVQGESTGCWVTSAACWVLTGAQDRKFEQSIERGLRWICDDWPRDSTAWRKWIRKLLGRQTRDSAGRGWGWTPGTSSWTEPTAFALLALESAQAKSLSGITQKRRQLGEILLYERMCPGGGWNCGNPAVYGVENEPLVIPTALALLALRRHAVRKENAEGIAWVERNFSQIAAPGSYAFARMCLNAYGCSGNVNGMRAAELFKKNESLRNVQVAAWMILAASDVHEWASAGESH
jgi:hypothetical protein